MTEVMTVRQAAVSDCEALVPLIASFRDHLGRREPATDAIASSLNRLLPDPSTEFLLAFDAKHGPLGYSQTKFRFSLWASGAEAQLDDLFVLPAARRSGVGTRLLAASIERARERGALVIGLNTNERNVEALHLYTRLGFTAVRARWGAGRQLWLELDL
jgi:GNAT superfamily N-acetyltransferase